MRLQASPITQLILFIVATLCATAILVIAGLNEVPAQGGGKPILSRSAR
jgi:hypothetical protein